MQCLLLFTLCYDELVIMLLYFKFNLCTKLKVKEFFKLFILNNYVSKYIQLYIYIVGCN